MYALGFFSVEGHVVVCSGAKERVYELVDDTHDEHVEVHLTWLMRAYLCW
jgi:hypothetical protein